MIKTYRGQRTDKGAVVTVDGKPLNPRNKVRNHSPDGFEWGYGGSGPAQLALAILCDYFASTADALDYYQDFKFKVIGRLKGDNWTLTTLDIDVAVSEIKAEREAHP